MILLYLHGFSYIDLYQEEAPPRRAPHSSDPRLLILLCLSVHVCKIPAVYVWADTVWGDENKNPRKAKKEKGKESEASSLNSHTSMSSHRHMHHVTTHTLIVGVSVWAVNNGAVDCEGTGMTQTAHAAKWIHACGAIQPRKSTKRLTHKIKKAWSLTCMTFPSFCLCVCATSPSAVPAPLTGLPRPPIVSSFSSIVLTQNRGMSRQ